MSDFCRLSHVLKYLSVKFHQHKGQIIIDLPKILALTKSYRNFLKLIVQFGKITNLLYYCVQIWPGNFNLNHVDVLIGTNLFIFKLVVLSLSSAVKFYVIIFIAYIYAVVFCEYLKVISSIFTMSEIIQQRSSVKFCVKNVAKGFR